jgi:hypothetical protein
MVIGSFALGFFVFALFVFFLVIALTLVLGGISRGSDKRVETEGRATDAQRPPTDLEAHGY